MTQSHHTGHQALEGGLEAQHARVSGAQCTAQQSRMLSEEMLSEDIVHLKAWLTSGG